LIPSAREWPTRCCRFTPRTPMIRRTGPWSRWTPITKSPVKLAAPLVPQPARIANPFTATSTHTASRTTSVWLASERAHGRSVFYFWEFQSCWAHTQLHADVSGDNVLANADGLLDDTTVPVNGFHTPQCTYLETLTQP
jgi:hypothetical protein